MRKSLGFILAVITLFSISITNANDCTKACSAEGRPYIDTKVSDEKFFLFNYCQLRCHSSNFACRGNAIVDDVRRLKNDANWANNCKAMSDEAFSQKRETEAREERAIKKERTQAKLNEMDRKHQETMEAIRNQQNQAAAAQARTQTSQNNSPSSSSDNDSYSTSNSQTSSTNSKRLDNPAALINECISIKSGGGGLKNNCGFTVYYSYCTLNGINNPVNKCEQNGLGAAGMGSYEDDGYSGLAGDKINWFACKAPSMPKQTNYDPQHGVITGYCSN